ncbi:2-oxoglutarate dehydrogenase E1 component [Variovorax sp. GT1P44]|uniref:2-oxoglutarate dehydrogenase E1 component n=1 Tax=Variovorax sp. GT1P44 TaxID=3443742 RepID=UPI003F478FFD
MLKRNRTTSFLYGGNAPYVEELYEAYLTDPNAVSDDWRSYFDALQTAPAVDGSSKSDVAHRPVVDHFAALARQGSSNAVSSREVTRFARKQVAVQSLIAAYRMVGTRKARLDPLAWAPIPDVPDLAPSYHGLTPGDLLTTFSRGDTFLFEDDVPLADLVAALEETYCGTLSAEFMHLADAAQRRWWQSRLESTRARPTLTREKKLRILERLTAAEGLEKHLHTRYVGQTRFSLEGGESLIVLLDALIQSGASHGVRSLVMGMAHRGRLNVLVNTVGKPPRALFDEFEGRADGSLLAGDVKYHKGYAGEAQTDAGPVEVLLAFNPSHLEVVNPVVQGMARARGEALDNPAAVLPVEIHGDAAMAGQGVVMETLSLGYTRGHGTGGTVHVAVNNQVGFTTSDPRDARSSFYCTDIAKMIEAPVLHVNGGDPEAVLMAAQLAVEYRATFNRSVVIELVCFRRHGHQEQDTPNMTQPLMYRSIAAHPGFRSLYADKLVDEGVLSSLDVEYLQRTYRERLDIAHSASSPAGSEQPSSDVQPSPRDTAPMPSSPPARDHLQALAKRITAYPDDYQLHPLVAKVMSARREMAAGLRPLDWGMGEHLAFASLLATGTDVRLSGQDSARGTFGHRHAVLHNQNRDRRSDGVYEPLAHVSPSQGRFTVTNSILSEAAVMAFEYGYSLVHESALVLWEAQFGDFANGAQVVIDQFLSAGEAKWGQRSGLTLLLPHGQDGQGPEHASARLERYLQLCAQENMQVCQPTTPAQFFHLLRKQAVSPHRRPLIVMTPKSLLRHPAAVSSLDELADGKFQEVLGDSLLLKPAADAVERVVLCTGKVYYELVEHRRAHGLHNTAIVRLEQLYPFPDAPLRAQLALYPKCETIVWCQEEAENQGAWVAVERTLHGLAGGASLQYAGPPAAASTAPGGPAAHALQQAALIADAFRDPNADAIETLEPDSDPARQAREPVEAP